MAATEKPYGPQLSPWASPFMDAPLPADPWADVFPAADDGTAACHECGMTRAEMPAAEEWAGVPVGTGICCMVPLNVSRVGAA